MSRSTSERLVALFCLWLMSISAIEGRGKDDAAAVGTSPASYAASHMEVYLFPVEAERDCPREVYDWIYHEAGRITVNCSLMPVFRGGIDTSRLSRPSLLVAGTGVYPYVVVDMRGTPHMRVAVTLPSVDQKSVHTLRFVADETEHVVTIGPELRPLVVQSGDTRLEMVS